MSTQHWADSRLEIHRVVVGPFENNVFVLRCKETGDAVLIDAANEHEQLLEMCTRLGVRRVLETHGHWDHIQAVPAMREAGYEVGVTSLDAPMLKDVGYDVFIDDAEVIEVGRLRLRAIHNPGHTVGSVSFQVEGAPIVCTGDTLFPGGPGARARSACRTDYRVRAWPARRLGQVVATLEVNHVAKTHRNRLLLLLVIPAQAGIQP